MLTLPAEFQARLERSVTTLAICWVVTMRNGELILGTEHDRDIEITTGDLAGVYLAGAGVRGSDVRQTGDLAVDNTEVEGALGEIGIDIRVEDIEAGVLDQARTTIFVVDWEQPDLGQRIMGEGIIGEITRDAQGRYRAERRGFKQYLSQNIGRTYGERCDVVEFGDHRCKFDIAGAVRTGDVSAVTSRKVFEVTLETGGGASAPTTTYFNGAGIEFVTGANAGFRREVKSAVIDGDDVTITLYEEAPADLEVGDDVLLPPGCDRRYTTCRDVHNNLDNFRGHGVFIPGVLAMMRGPKGGTSHQ